MQIINRYQCLKSGVEIRCRHLHQPQGNIEFPKFALSVVLPWKANSTFPISDLLTAKLLPFILHLRIFLF